MRPLHRRHLCLPGVGRGFDLGALILERLCADGYCPEPDLMREPGSDPGFDVPPEVAAERLAAARTPIAFEAEGVEFFQRVARAMPIVPPAPPQRFARLDGAQPPRRSPPGAGAAVAASVVGWRGHERQRSPPGLPRSAPVAGPARPCLAAAGPSAWGGSSWRWSWCAPGCAMRPPQGACGQCASATA